MKSLLLLPLSLLAVSCFPSVPYNQQRPPYRNGEPYYPYGSGGRPPGGYDGGSYNSPDGRGSGAGSETGQFEPVPGNRQPPVTPAPPVAPRPTSPRIDPHVEVPDTPAPTPRPTHPEATRTANPNQVISPFAPYNVIDVEGFKSGQLAKDPSNGKIFRVP